MPTSDSEDFESADEGDTGFDKKDKKKRLHSSNYSDNALETFHEPKNLATSIPKNNKPKANEETDGWDDFDIDQSETIESKPLEVIGSDKLSKTLITEFAKGDKSSQDTGWDDFGDWGEDDITDKQEQLNISTTKNVESNKNVKEVTDKLSEMSTKSGGWGWGWGVDSLLSTATAGITTLTNQVSQSISTVLETGIGAPGPEELAKLTVKETNTKKSESDTPDEQKSAPLEKPTEVKENMSETSFPFGSLLSGVTKFVETTGSKVITGGLDTLETIGKKTMEVLQDGDPGLAKKRSLLLGLGPDKPVLSQVLREAKARAEEEDKIREEKQEAKEVHYENLFDDFEGLVHLEALEMLSRQVSMRIDERLRAAQPDKKQDIKETLQQVAELCELPEEEDDDNEEPPAEGVSMVEAFHERLQTATQDLGLKLQFQSMVKQYTEILEWLSREEDPTDLDFELTNKIIYKRAVSSLAQCTALSVELYHKAAEMLLVKTRRSTADETDAITQMTVVLTKHVSELATLFTEKMNSLDDQDLAQSNSYITNIFLEAGNSSTYIQNAFQLMLPILQIGAV